METPGHDQEDKPTFPADDYLSEYTPSPAETDEHGYLTDAPPEQPQAYDGMPYGLRPSKLSRTSEPGKSTYKWNVPVEKVDADERDRRVLESPMERILEMCGKYPPIPYSRTRELIARKEKGDLDAKEQLILHNMRLVVHMAKKYRHRGMVVGMPMEDLFQDGILGLSRAVEKTSLDRIRRPTSFSAYAGEYISRGIIRGIHKKGDVIALPTQLQERIDPIKMAEARLTTELGHEPTDEEIAQTMSFYPIKPVELQEEGKQDETEGQYSEARITRARWLYEAAAEEAIEEVKLYRNMRKHPLSLERLLEEDEDNPIFEDLSPGPEDQAAVSIRNQDLYDLMQNLEDRERSVLEQRTGVRPNEENAGDRTLDEVGRTFNVTRERIRQIENAAYKKLGDMPGGEKLIDSTEDPIPPQTEAYILKLQGIHRADEEKMMQRFGAGHAFEQPRERDRTAPKPENPLGYPEGILQSYGPESARLSRLVLLTFVNPNYTETKTGQLHFSTVSDTALRRLATVQQLNIEAVKWVAEQLDKYSYVARIFSETGRGTLLYPTRLANDYLTRQFQ